MKRLIAFSALLVLFGLISPVPQCLADGFIVVDPAHWRPGPRPRPMPPPWPHQPYDFAPLEVTYHHVNVKIDDQIATTSVDQEFYNPNPQQLEGTYLFPVPKGAQINKFAMDIGGKQVEAELLPAAKARRIWIPTRTRSNSKARIFSRCPRARRSTSSPWTSAASRSRPSCSPPTRRGGSMRTSSASSKTRHCSSMPTATCSRFASSPSSRTARSASPFPTPRSSSPTQAS